MFFFIFILFIVIFCSIYFGTFLLAVKNQQKSSDKKLSSSIFWPPQLKVTQ
nr:ATP synthase F0 subunit 8 [Oxylipeurus chiniri]